MIKPILFFLVLAGVFVIWTHASSATRKSVQRAVRKNWKPVALAAVTALGVFCFALFLHYTRM